MKFLFSPTLVAIRTAAVLGSLLISSVGQAATFDLQGSIFGYMRGTYGNGSRYGALAGYDRMGLSQFAVGVEASMKDNYKFVGLFAADVLSNGDGSGANVGIKDTFISIASINESKFGLSIGAQPLLFGLKANGYPGDSSINPSIEFISIFGPSSNGVGLTNRAFAVSQQAGPSVRVTYNADQQNRLVFGLFDTAERAPTRNSGSSIHQNVMLYYKSDEFLLKGLQLFAGGMTRYIGKAVDNTTDHGEARPIYDLGVAYKAFDALDISVEAISIHKDFTGSTDNEMLLVTEAEFHFTERNSIYVDYGSAQKLEIKTLRAGVKHQVDKPLLFQAEFSQDTFEKGNLAAAGARSSVESVDVMLKYMF